MRKVRYFFICLIILLFTACRKENDSVINYDDNKIRNELDNTKFNEINVIEGNKDEKEKPLFIIGESSYILWKIPYNLEEENAVKYISQAGEWKRPLGLYSYAVSKNYLFVEDSANQRIVWFQENEKTQVIELPEKMIGKQMVYVEEENILYILLFDNVAAEPNTLSYCKVDLNESLTIKNLEEVPYETWLNYLGQPIQEVGILDTSKVEEIEKQMEQIESLKNSRKKKIKFITECEGINLYMSYLPKSKEGILLFVRDENIIAHSEILSLGEFSLVFPSCAYLYVEDEVINVTYMSQNHSEIKIITPQLIDAMK